MFHARALRLAGAHRPGRAPALAALAVTCAAALAACAGSGGSAGSTAASVSGAAAAAAPQAASGQAGSTAQDSAGAKSALGSAFGASDAAAVSPRLVRTAEVSVEVTNLSAAAALVRAAAESLGGAVASETTSYTAGGAPAPIATGADSSSGKVIAQPGESVIVIRVPEPSLDQAIAKVTAPTVGRELGRATSSQDVTADLADLASRVKSQQASVDRIRVLMVKASSLQDVVLLESELSKREGDLEALEARQASLADRADLATLTVDLRTPEAGPVPTTSDDGFVAGLRSGWHAVVASTTVVLTVLGAALPVVLVLLALGWPALILLRRYRRRPARRVSAGSPAPAVPVDPAPAP